MIFLLHFVHGCGSGYDAVHALLSPWLSSLFHVPFFTLYLSMSISVFLDLNWSLVLCNSSVVSFSHGAHG